MMIFLSYSQSDSELAREVSENLKETGIEIEDGKSILNPGDVWAAKLGNAIGSSDAVVVLVPEDTSEASWTYAELAMAFEAQKPIVPLLPSKSIEVPPLLAPFQYVDISNEDSRSEVLRRLGAQLTRLSGGSRPLENDIESIGHRIDELRKISESSYQAREERLTHISRSTSMLAVSISTLALAAAIAAVVFSSRDATGSLMLVVAGLGVLFTVGASMGAVLRGEALFRMQRPTKHRDLHRSEADR